MNRILDKILIFTLCMVFYLPNRHTIILVVPVLSAVTVSAFLGFFERRELTLFCLTLFCLASSFFPEFFFFLPLICYDVFRCGPKWAALFAVLPAAVNYARLSPFTFITIILTVLLVFLSEQRTGTFEKLSSEYITLRDTTREFALKLENKNRELMEKQDYEVRIATLNERNRIAREIHDSVGHLLTSSILQIGAMLATCRDEKVRENLGTLKGTLSQGMDSIRSSIHNLYDESIDLQTEVQTLVNGFRFCPVSLHYDINTSPGKDIKYTMAAVLKEALSNVIKHSDATLVAVTLREHPGFYQMIIKDNGTKKPPCDGSGIGLQNIRSRVEKLRGNVSISAESGFLLFVSVPKEETE